MNVSEMNKNVLVAPCKIAFYIDSIWIRLAQVRITSQSR